MYLFTDMLLFGLKRNSFAGSTSEFFTLYQMKKVKIFLHIKSIYNIPSCEILEFPSVINFDIITSDNIKLSFSLPALI